MQLVQIQNNPFESFDYMERLVNDGSPSGFTQIHNTSKQTNPIFSKEFCVKKLYPNRGQIIKCGEFRGVREEDSDESFIYIHPDWELYLRDEIYSIGDVIDGITVIPTSSSRTVRIKGTHRFLKLHYPGMLGRIQRDLGVLHLSYAVEITKVLNKAKSNNCLPETFDYMPEYYGRVLKDNNREIGFVCRELPLYEGTKYYIPAFSLFSTDFGKPSDGKLLIQLMSKHDDDALSFFLNDICYPLLDVFFYCTFNLGLIPEMHSQNIVYVFDEAWNTKKVLLRDFESIDVDYSIRNGLGFKDTLLCPTNKAIHDKDENYLKRHSFMFDHKLCEYLIEPLVKCAMDVIKDKDIVCQIKEYCVDKYGGKYRFFFPEDGCWYKYPNKEIDRSSSFRPYISMGIAKYR